MRDEKTYSDLQEMFGPYYPMPQVDISVGGHEIEYRCPYIPKCPANARCLIVVTPEPLQDNDILSVKCRLCGGRKIPIYAYAARLSGKKE